MRGHISRTERWPELEIEIDDDPWDYEIPDDLHARWLKALREFDAVQSEMLEFYLANGGVDD
jgi:hypothetical protein